MKIAIQNNMNYNYLKKINGMISDDIYAGQTIKIVNNNKQMSAEKLKELSLEELELEDKLSPVALKKGLTMQIDNYSRLSNES